jgi:predicted dithiol-disulfide oxidoreductase (DUF899 family)
MDYFAICLDTENNCFGIWESNETAKLCEKVSMNPKVDSRIEALERRQTMTPHEIVSQKEWLVVRKKLLTKEKELTKPRDQLSEERRALPWVKVEKYYVFDVLEGKVTLAQLFDGRSQLFVKHFMMGPVQIGQCVGCSFEVDHLEGILTHLNLKP